MVLSEYKYSDAFGKLIFFSKKAPLQVWLFDWIFDGRNQTFRYWEVRVWISSWEKNYYFIFSIFRRIRFLMHTSNQKAFQRKNILKTEKFRQDFHGRNQTCCYWDTEAWLTRESKSFSFLCNFLSASIMLPGSKNKVFNKIICKCTVFH